MQQGVVMQDMQERQVGSAILSDYLLVLSHGSVECRIQYVVSIYTKYVRVYQVCHLISKYLDDAVLTAQLHEKLYPFLKHIILNPQPLNKLAID